MVQSFVKGINVFLYSILYPAHIVALFGIFLYPYFFGFGLKELVCIFIGWILLAGLGSAITLHRIVSHRAIQVRSYLKPVLLWLASLCLQGSPLGWAAIHRGGHHRHSDTERDPHTPRKGWLYSYHGWLHDWDTWFNPKYVVDLLSDPMQLFFARHYIKIILGSYIIIGLIDPTVLLFTFIIPAVYSLHQESLVNLRCHLPGGGYRNFDTRDDSNNRPLMGYLVWGQAWHNNHHHRPGSFDFGSGISSKWWEFDPSRLFLPLLAKKKDK